jgi:[acyl-carrier-protein] S-malonyltransferase
MKIAFVFPGQGSQYIGMGKEIYENFDVARGVFKEASDELGMILRHVFNGTKLNKTLTAVCSYSEYSNPPGIVIKRHEAVGSSRP